MRKVGRRKMFVVIGILLVIIGALMIWFNISYSPLKKQFDKDTQRLVKENRLETSSEVFTEKDFQQLPQAIRRYVENCGYIGKPKMSYLKMQYKDVDFKTGRNGAKLKMDYTQYNFVKEPCRMDFNDASMFGVPFQGYDSYENGKGGMKGVLAKLITLFNETGEEMDRACLVTFLAESLFVPTVLTQDYVTFEQTGEYEVTGRITCKGQTVSGVFSFNEQYEMVSFTTNDRAATGTDGKSENIPWTARCDDYELNDSGIRQPKRFRAIWNYDDGDFVYFDGQISSITYG